RPLHHLPISHKRRTPRHPSTFPYTTLFRSDGADARGHHTAGLGDDHLPPARRRARPEPGPLPPRLPARGAWPLPRAEGAPHARLDRKSTRLNSSHVKISYAVFCLKKKNRNI